MSALAVAVRIEQPVARVCDGGASPYRIAPKILVIRGLRVMLDADIAKLYGVSVKRLNEAVSRNRRRFPADFMFRLSPPEQEALVILRSQFATSSWGGRRYRPNVFTQEGVAMLSGVLQSRKAIDVNVAIMRAFARFRHWISTEHRLARKLDELERRLEGHDGEIQTLFEAIRTLTAGPASKRRRIGFQPEGGS